MFKRRPTLRAWDDAVHAARHDPERSAELARAWSAAEEAEPSGDPELIAARAVAYVLPRD